MNRFYFLFFIFSLILVISCNEYSPKKIDKLETDADKVSYALGMNIISSFQQQGVDLNLNIFFQAVRQGANNEDFLLTEGEVKQILIDYSNKLKVKQQAKKELESNQEKTNSENFHQEKSKDTNVITLESGLQYKILKEGSGEKPKAENAVKVHYEGSLIDGTVFDSSYTRGTPVEFTLRNVIKGWTEGLQLMPVGSTWEFYIPSKLAYGSNPPLGSKIKPGSTLVFKVELLEIILVK